MSFFRQDSNNTMSFETRESFDLIVQNAELVRHWDWCWAMISRTAFLGSITGVGVDSCSHILFEIEDHVELALLLRLRGINLVLNKRRADTGVEAQRWQAEDMQVA